MIERSSRVSTKDGDQQYIFLQKESSNVAEVPEVPYPRLTAGWVARGRIVSRIGLFPRRDLPLASPPGSRSAPTICASISVNGLQRRGTWAASVGHRRQARSFLFGQKGLAHKFLPLLVSLSFVERGGRQRRREILVGNGPQEPIDRHRADRGGPTVGRRRIRAPVDHGRRHLHTRSETVH